jgi:hypothetical protein
MPKPRANDAEQDKIARFERIKKAITVLEKQQAIILRQGALAPQLSDCTPQENERDYIQFMLKPPRRLL